LSGRGGRLVISVWDPLLDRRDQRRRTGAAHLSTHEGNRKKRRNRDEDRDERRQTHGRKRKYHETLLKH